MNDAQSTTVGLKAQDCPGGGWTGQPGSIKRATVSDCLAHDVCGCIYGDAVQHIERLRKGIQDYLDGNYGPKIIGKIDKCQHGHFGYEACEGCIDEHFSKLLTAEIAS